MDELKDKIKDICSVIVNEEENKDSSIFYDNLKLLLSSYDPFNITDEKLAELKQNLFSKKCMALYDDIRKLYLPNLRRAGGR